MQWNGVGVELQCIGIGVDWSLIGVEVDWVCLEAGFRDSCFCL